MSKTANKITALYCRTAQSSPFGIEHQKQFLLHYAQERGLGPDDVAFFIDDSFSGTTLDRPAFQRVLAGIRAGEVGEVVAKDEPRYGRKCLEVHELAHDLWEQYGVKLLTVMDGDPFQTHDGLVTALLRPASKGGAEMKDVLERTFTFRNILSTEAITEAVTAIYCRLSVDDQGGGDEDSNSIQHQELICKGWFLPPNTYDCGSFVVNRKAVVGKEQKSLITAINSAQKGAFAYEIVI